MTLMYHYLCLNEYAVYTNADCSMIFGFIISLDKMMSEKNLILNPIIS